MTGAGAASVENIAGVPCLAGKLDVGCVKSAPVAGVPVIAGVSVTARVAGAGAACV